MSGAISLLPQYAFNAWFSEQMDNFTFTFTLAIGHEDGWAPESIGRGGEEKNSPPCVAAAAAPTSVGRVPQ
jgi:hypothetical protein